MKKLYSLLLCLFLILGISNSILAVENSENNFVEVLSEKGIISGYEDGTFGLDQEITRAEFAAIAVRMLDLEGLAKSSSYNSNFKDVEAGRWYTGYVNVAAGKGLLKGYNDKTFRPEKKITLAEAVTIVVRIVDGEITVGNWPTNYLVRASDLGIFEDVRMSEAKAPAKRETVFRLVYNGLFHQSEDGEVKSTIVKGLVIENDRVESVDSGKLVIELIQSVGESRKSPKGGMQFEYTLKENEDPEVFLGKVVEVDFLGDSIKSIRIDPEYDYLTGKIEEISKNSITINDRKYTVQKEDRFGNPTSNRIYQVYVNSEDISYVDFVDYESVNFAKVTVSNGKVMFIDAYDIDEIGPVDSVKNGSMRVRDDRRGGIKDAVDLEDIFVLSFEKNGDYYDLKRGKASNVKAGDMAYYDEGEFAIIDHQAKILGKLEKISISKKKITVNGKQYELSFEEEPIGNCIYSENGVQYETLEEDNFHKVIDNSFGKQVSINLDIYGKVQMVTAGIEYDTGVFALVKDIFVDEIVVKDSNNAKRTYDIDLDTNYYKVKLEELYDSDNFEKMKGTPSENIRELRKLIKDAEKDALVYLQLKGNVIKDLTFVDMDDAWFRTKRAKDDYILVQDPVNEKYYAFDEYDFVDTRVIVLGTDLQGMTPEYFLKKYAVSEKYPLSAALIPYKNVSNRVRYLFAKPSGNSDGARTKEIIRKIVDVDLNDDADYIELESSDGVKRTHKIADSRVAKMAAEKELEVGDIILGNVIYNDAKDIVKAKVLIEGDTEYVYKVLDVDKNNITLGFGEDTDTPVNKFDDDNQFDVEFSSEHEAFGDIETGNFVSIHYDEDQKIDAIVEMEEPDNLADGGKTYFAEVRISSLMLNLQKIVVQSAPVGKYYRLKRMSEDFFREYGEAQNYDARDDEDYVKIYLYDDEKELIGEIEVRVDKNSEKTYPIKMYE